MKISRISIIFIFLFFTKSFADNICTKDGGDYTCSPAVVSEWQEDYSISDCYPNLSAYALWCTVRGGEPDSPYYVGGCMGNPTATTEQNYLERANQYIGYLTENNPEDFEPITYEETSWGLSSNACYGKAKYKFGVLVSDRKVINYDYGGGNFANTGIDKVISLARYRDVTCPEGMITTKDPSGFLQCYTNRPQPQCPGDPDLTVGNPCFVTSGDKTLNENDWHSSHSPLKVTRHYSSLHSATRPPWTHNYQANIRIGSITHSDLTVSPRSLNHLSTAAVLHRPNGTYVVAQRLVNEAGLSEEWFINRDLNLQLTAIDADTWQVRNTNTNTVEIYQKVSSDEQSDFTYSLTKIIYQNGDKIDLAYNNSQLKTVTDHYGKQLKYTYQNQQIASILLPNGHSVQYGYDTNGRLSTVLRPGFGSRTYLYDEIGYAPNDNPNLLTGIINENGDRYATYGYDEKNRGVLTQHANETQRFSLTYDENSGYKWGNSTTWVEDEYGNRRSYFNVIKAGSYRIFNQQHADKLTYKKYDDIGNLIEIDKSGRLTKYTYDQTRNLRTSEVRAFGTADSTITLTEWHPTLPVKTQVTEGTANTDGTLNETLRITNYTHDDKGNVLSKTVADAQTGQTRTWRYTYNAFSQRLTETDPRNLTQSWVYNTDGYVTQFTDSQGLVTTFGNFTADGNPQLVTTPTGQTTALTYDAAGRVTEMRETIALPTLNPFNGNDITHDGTQTAITTYAYDGVGQLVRTRLPDGQTIDYEYDAAHRLVGVSDNLGNRLVYTLNGAGDITQTDSYDPAGTLVNRQRQAFDTMGRLAKQTGNNGQFEQFTYDYWDRLTNTSDALSRRNRATYDGLGRQVTDEDANNGTVRYAYDGLDNLISVTDARGNATTYVYNAFGELLSEASPDSGTTTSTYNAKGQLTRQTDAEGRVQRYQYDALGRLDKVFDAANQVVTHNHYDAQGRLSRIDSPQHNLSMAYVYDSANRVIEKTQRLGSQAQVTRYHYTPGGQLDQLLLPSRRLVAYQYNNGVLTGIALRQGNQATQLIDNVTFNTNGLTSYRWSQTGSWVRYDYDLDGRLTNLSDPALNRAYGYDVGNRLVSLTDATAGIAYTFTHDKLDRLTLQDLGLDSLSYTYDRNSNRTRRVGNSVTTNTPIAADSNRLVNATYDTSGRTLNDGSREYSYDSKGRIAQITRDGVTQTNVYNGLGQRVQQSDGTNTTVFSYDEQGKLLGEYTPNNQLIREYIYLGNQPIALISHERPNEVLAIHADHLGTPRAVTDSTGTTLWQWEGDAFGDVAPQLETVTMPLRMAGQYHDSETGLFYNYYRYYDPATGRYLRSDPIGLAGGMNTYAYVGGNPTAFVDPLGLQIANIYPDQLGWNNTSTSGINIGGLIKGGLKLCGRLGGGVVLLILENSVSSTSACDQGPANPQSCLDDEHNDCKPYIDNIKYLISKIRDRYYLMLLDKYRLFTKYKKIRNPHPDGHGSWFGHHQKYLELQRDLKIAISQLKAHCRPYLPFDAEEWANKPPPTQPNRQLANDNGYR